MARRSSGGGVTDIILVIGIIGLGVLGFMYLLPQMQQQQGQAAPEAEGGAEAEGGPLKQVLQWPGTLELPSLEQVVQNLKIPGAENFRIPDFSGQQRTAPKFVPNLARPGGGQQVIKPTFIPRPGTTVTKPKYVANKMLTTKCIVEPFGDGNYWKCYYQNGKTVKQGKWWKCGGLLAQNQNPGHVCRP